MKKPDTSEYSSSLAPETREHAEERDPYVDSRLIPGGAEPRSHTAQGIAGLDDGLTPSGTADPGSPVPTRTEKDETSGT